MSSEVPFKSGFKTNELWQAVVKGDVRKTDKLIKTGADITFKKENKSLLVVARELEMSNQSSGDIGKFYSYKQIRSLVELSLNTSVLTEVTKGDVNRVRALAGADANLYQDGKLLFGAASSSSDNAEIVTILLCNNQMNEQYVEAIQQDGKTYIGSLIAEAQRHNNTECIKAFKKHISYVLVRESEAGNLPRVQHLLKLGQDFVDLSFKRSDGQTALMVAVDKKRFDVVSILISNGADISQVNSQGQTARDLCKRDVRLTAMLDKVGLVKDLRSAIRSNGAKLNPNDIGSYLDKGVQVNSRDADGNSILLLAVQYKCSTDVLTDLIKTYHADPNILNKRGLGPVEMGLVYGDADTLKCLFEAGVNIKRGKNMLLEYAKANGFPGAVELINEEFGKLLWKAVDDENFEEIKEMLQNCGVSVDEKCKLEGYEGWTALFLAAHKNNIKVLKLLCDSQADVDARSVDEQTAIFVAVQTGRTEALQYLISESASVNIIDTNGNTPLSFAIKNNNEPQVRILLHHGADPYHKQGGIPIAQFGHECPNKNIAYLFEQLDFFAAIPDWEEDKKDKKAGPNFNFFRPPISFDLSPPAKLQMVMQGNPKVNKKLLESAKEGRPVPLKEAIAEGADIRCFDNKMKRPLDLAKEKLLKLENEQLSSIEIKRQQQQNFRFYYRDIVQFLTQKLHEQLWNAVQSETLERVQTLHECGAPLDWRAPERPLGLPGLLACTQDKPEILAYLLHNCAENVPLLRTVDMNGRSLLSMAEKNGFKKLSSWIRGRMTYSLQQAMTSKDVAAAKHILNLGSGPELKRSDGNSNLCQAVEMGDLELVKLLVDAGADCSVKHQGHTMIDIARIKGNVQITRFITQSLTTAKLFDAANSGNIESIRKLHLQGGKVDCHSYMGITPLKAAFVSGDTKSIHYLISRGASLVRSDKSVNPIGKLESLNDNEPLKNYIQRSVDEQFLATVIEGDSTKLDLLLQLGANIAYCNPNSKETAISLCINYHSVDMLKFLENRGSVLTSPADAKGNYALGIAAARGNTAVVEYLLQEININKTLTNEDGKTPLQIAEASDHQEVVRLLGGEVKDEKGKKVYNPPKYKLQELIQAVKNCNMTIIKEFIEEIYSRRDEKVYHCVEMWKESQKENQKEVEKKLAHHYQELIEDTSEHKLTGSAESQVILTGFLRSLSAQITGCALDPNDPRSYDMFFQNMNEKAEEARKKILVDDLNQLKENFKEELVQVQEALSGLKQQKEQMHVRDREYFERIAQMKVQLSEEQSARERDRIRKEMMSLQDDMKTLHAQQEILEAQQKRQNMHYEASKRFEATHINLLLFYRTVSLGVEEIFVGAKAVASSMVVSSGGSLSTKASVVEGVATGILSVFSFDPIVGGLTKSLVKVATKVMKDVDKYRQKEIAQYISCLATIGEQTDICTDVAYRLTLWYSDQIKCLASPSDSTKNSENLSAPARRMAQIAVGIIYTSLTEKVLENAESKVSQFSTLGEKLAWCVVTQKPKNGTISKLQKRATEFCETIWKKSGYFGSKVPPNFIKVELDEEFQTDSQKTWMLCDIFHKTGIIDRDGNIYKANHCDPKIYKFCYGTEMAATELGFARLDVKMTAPQDALFIDDLFVGEDVISVSGTGGTKGNFVIAPGKIDERIQKILEEEKLDRSSMENAWKEDIREVQEETIRKTDELEERQNFLETELRDQIIKIEEVAEEKTKLHENNFAKYQSQLLTKFNELKQKMDDHFQSVIKKMQADMRKEFDSMQKRFKKKEEELDAAFQTSQQNLNAHYAATEKRLEKEKKKQVDELSKKSEEFSEALRKENVKNFQFAKEQVEQFCRDKIKEIKKIEEAAVLQFEEQCLAYKKDSDAKTALARQELINIMESKTERYYKEIKDECSKNLSTMEEANTKLKKQVESLEKLVMTLEIGEKDLKESKDSKVSKDSKKR
ncbi:uncharacterized protein LOC124458519 isoform X3 [Xenia sp. Carnegie-2017]|uniref:uncharacterized protein LOC124458519 isoform X3 n=1 Tax=Xenia sp. Carnegie-2017 TaxID=2897299 RepID=UPI001F03898C|nr:uncharacterized protein LOC124458519 isoform X3 [Xenia sp. Carnegie-2017]